MRARRGFKLLTIGGVLMLFALTARRHIALIQNVVEDAANPAPATQTSKSIPTNNRLSVNVNTDDTNADADGLQNALLKNSIAGALPSPGRDNSTDTMIPYAPFYKHISCLTEKSYKPCGFPLLTDYFKRCGYFAESTNWRYAKKGYPKATMTAEICKVPPVTSEIENLRRYITERNISSILTVGDSHAYRSHKALIRLFGNALFQCTMLKQEPSGKQISLEYYTRGTGFKTNATAGRICASCDSCLHVCTDTDGRNVSVEYISMDMGSRKQIRLSGSECQQNPKHPLCLNLTQQEYVFKHYLKRNEVYPELLLIFSVFAHTVFTPLQKAFDAIRGKWQLITDSVPESSDIIWYGGTPYNIMNLNQTTEPRTPEGIGLPVNNKMQILNHFLASVITNHFAEGGRPVYTFYDMYHMQARMKEAWKLDNTHFKPVWYQYVIAYTSSMLNSLPLH
jgi:hypothetical protein